MKILVFKLFVFKWQVGAWTIFKIAVHGFGGSYSGKFLRLWELCISLPLLCEGTPCIPMASTNRRAVFPSKWVHLWDAIIRICLNFRLQCRDVPVSFEQACVMAAKCDKMKHPVGWLILLFNRSGSPPWEGAMLPPLGMIVFSWRI